MTPVLAEPCGAPTTPPGFPGSVTHKGPIAMALAAQGDGGVGVDLEFADAKDLDLARHVLTDSERDSLIGMESKAAALLVAVHFSVKEAVYKAVSLDAQQNLEFTDIQLLVPHINELALDGWSQVGVQIAGIPLRGRANMLLDGNWIVAVVRRFGRTSLET